MGNNSIYYDIYPLLSYNALFSMSVGMRSVGKTTAAARWACKDWINADGEGVCHFLWLRRYKSELKDIVSFFSNIETNGFFPKHEWRVEGRKAQVSYSYTAGKKVWSTFGSFAALTEGISKKGVPFPRVNKLIFDEFIIPPKKKLYYINDEVTYFMEFLNTVDRYDDRVRAVLLANAADIVNPYFLEWGITEPDREFTKYHGGDIVLEWVDNEQFREYAGATRLGSFIDGTSYGSYALDNEFINSDDSFIRDKTRNAKFQYAFSFNKRSFGIWRDASLGDWFVTTKIPRGTSIKFTLTRNDMRPNLIMLETSSPLLKKILAMYRYGYVYFDDVQTREQFMKMMELCGLK